MPQHPGNQPHIREIFGRAITIAVQGKYQYVTVEHVALSLLADRSVIDALSRCNADVSKIIFEIEKAVDEQSPKQNNSNPAPTRAVQRRSRSIHNRNSDRYAQECGGYTGPEAV